MPQVFSIPGQAFRVVAGGIKALDNLSAFRVYLVNLVGEIVSKPQVFAVKG